MPAISRDRVIPTRVLAYSRLNPRVFRWTWNAAAGGQTAHLRDLCPMPVFPVPVHSRAALLPHVAVTARGALRRCLIHHVLTPIAYQTITASQQVGALVGK
jgi:hypothetical protein